jgi:modification methylase
VWEIRPETGHKDHPAVFPLELPTRIIYSILGQEKGVVIDPFCGTGTTLVASKLLGKDYIGIDISEEYVLYTQERLAQAHKERQAVLKEIALHTTELTFKERKSMGLWNKKIAR